MVSAEPGADSESQPLSRAAPAPDLESTTGSTAVPARGLRSRWLAWVHQVRDVWDRSSTFSAANAGAIALVLAHLVIVARCAWIVEEAYISFRVVDNIIHGYGPRFNVIERVCVLTNPLWTLIMACAASITHDVFYTAMGIQIALAGLTAWIIAKNGSRWGAVLGLVALSLSKAYVDWATSGMENGLGQLLFVLFLSVFLRRIETLFQLGALVVLAALIAFNRLDSTLLVAPATLVATARFVAARRASRSKVAWTLLAGASPILAWELFSVVYYGFPVPNTYFAKLTTGVPTRHLVAQGIHYLHYSVVTDPLTIALIAFGILLALFGPERKALWPVGIGIAALSTYVIYVGGDFMAGRFWSLPFLAAVAIAARTPLRQRTGAPQGIAIAVALLAWGAGLPTLNRYYYDLRGAVPANESGIGDYARGLYVHTSLEFSLEYDMPTHEWIQAGRDAGKTPETVPVWGGMGFGPYFGGPGLVVIDKFGLADGLLSHLPIANPTGRTWRIGHFERAIPAGYVTSVEKRMNLLQNADLARFYDDLLLIERGPIFSRSRFAAMWRVWTGAHKERIRRYAEAAERGGA